jgi:ribosome maturation factor RimP
MKVLDMSSTAILSKIEAIAERVAEPEGIEIVEIELKGGGKNRFLRISIDKPEGVTHGDCELISHQVGTILDVEDVVPGAYTLEVSSPGVERKLQKYKDFERFIGKKIKAILREPVENSRRWEGTLASCADGLINLEVAEGKTIQFPFDQVEKANLKFEWGTRTN